MKALRPLAVLAAYLGIAALITYPLVLRIGEAFAGFPYGDAYESARHMWWMTHALRSGQPLFFQPLLAYPDGLPGLTLQATPLLLFPGWLFALALPLPIAYNLHVLLTLALNGWAMYGFARALTGRRDAASLAGVIFMSYPTLQGHLGASHLNILAQWGVPLYAWGLWRLTQTDDSDNTDAPLRVPTTFVVAVAFVAVAWAHTIQVIYTLMPITAFFAIRVLLRRTKPTAETQGTQRSAQFSASPASLRSKSSIFRRDIPVLRRIVLAAGLGAALTLLWLLPVLGDAFGGAYASDGGAVRYSADLLAAVTPSFFHPLWGTLPHTRAVLGVNLDEGAGCIGLIAGALALLGIWRRREARPWLWLALVTYVLSLGPLLKWNDQPVQFMTDGNIGTVALPWALFERLPGFELARTPGRFNLTTGFAIAVMVAFGAAWGLARVRRRAIHVALVVGCAGLILFDYQMFFPLPTTSTSIPQAIYDLREREDVRAVFDVPWDNLLAAKDALYLQTAHQHPLIAGHVTRRTPVDPAKLTLLESTLDPALLNDAGADIILLHKMYVDEAERARLIAALGEPSYEDERYALFERPQTTVPLSFATVSLKNSVHAFAPEAGWALLDTEITRGEGEITLMMGDQRIWTGVCAQEQDGRQKCRPYGSGSVETAFLPSDDGLTQNLRLPIALPAGYATLRWTTDPSCPLNIPPGLRCDTPALTMRLNDFVPGAGRAAAFDGGIRLDASHVVSGGDTVEVWLAWTFDATPTPTDIRFVHLRDNSDQLIGQVDSPPGVPSPGGWSEIIMLALPDVLPPGEYRVVVGWYRLPEVTPIPALGSDKGATRIEIGRVAIGSP